MIAPNVIRHCSLVGHEWVPCFGGKECRLCGTCDLNRSVVLPDLVPVADHTDLSDVVFYASILFFFASLVFVTVAIIHLYA